jgi:indole-3-glycerol phosphate synthase
MNVLEQIIANKKRETEELKNKAPVHRLEKSKYFQRETYAMSEFILSKTKTGIIAEFKRRSPSKGVMNSHSTVEEVTTGYFRSGASGLSILTDTAFFGGSSSDLMRARRLNSIPILRKDFIIDEYQVIETKAIGADVVLIIAAALSREKAKNLSRLARSFGLQVLLEVHNSRELGHLNEFVNMIGVNNRNLGTGVVDTETSVQMAEDIPEGFIKISESGITTPLIMNKLRNCGFQGFLIGERFMREPDPAVAFSEFVNQILPEHD